MAKIASVSAIDSVLARGLCCFDRRHKRMRVVKRTYTAQPRLGYPTGRRSGLDVSDKGWCQGFKVGRPEATVRKVNGVARSKTAHRPLRKDESKNRCRMSFRQGSRGPLLNWCRRNRDEGRRWMKHGHFC
jgi:hypothetical protein